MSCPTGVVSRSDLLQVFLRTGEDLRDEVINDIVRTVVPTDVDAVEVEVITNVVTLAGEVDRWSDAVIIERMTRDVDGVVDVINNLTSRWDDRRSESPPL